MYPEEEKEEVPNTGWNSPKFQVFIVFTSIFLDIFLLNCVIPFLSLIIKTQLHQSDLYVGLLYSAKSFTQVLCSPISGYISNRLGPRIPLLFGVLIIAGSSIMFAEVDTYVLLFIARALQGVGSSACFSAGMTHLAQIFHTDEERGTYMSLGLSGAGLAVLIAPPIGGVLYSLGGKPLPFYVVAGLCAVVFILQSLNLCCGKSRTKQASLPSLFQSITLFADPLILISCGPVFIANGAVALLEPMLPIWLKSIYDLSPTMLGLIFLPSTVGYFLATPIFGTIGHRLGRVKCIVFAMLILAGTMAAITLPRTLWLQFVSITGVGVSTGIIDGSTGVILATLLDTRHPGMGYGLVYALADMAFCLGYVIGPLLGSYLVQLIGLQFTFFGWAGACLLFTPLLYFIRNYQVSAEEEQYSQLIPHSELKVNYDDYDDD